MANQPIRNPKSFISEIPKVTTQDPVHADTVNPVYENLINNDVYLEDELNKHRSNKENPHNVTKEQVGLGNLQNFATATQAVAEAGTANNRFMTPLGTKQAIEKGNHVIDGDMVFKKPVDFDEYTTFNGFLEAGPIYSRDSVEIAGSLIVGGVDLKQSVSDGKSAIATAITDKGGTASGSDTFSDLASKIASLSDIGGIQAHFKNVLPTDLEFKQENTATVDYSDHEIISRLDGYIYSLRGNRLRKHNPITFSRLWISQEHPAGSLWGGTIVNEDEDFVYVEMAASNAQSGMDGWRRRSIWKFRKSDGSLVSESRTGFNETLRPIGRSVLKIQDCFPTLDYFYAYAFDETSTPNILSLCIVSNDGSLLSRFDISVLHNNILSNIFFTKDNIILISPVAEAFRVIVLDFEFNIISDYTTNNRQRLNNPSTLIFTQLEVDYNTGTVTAVVNFRQGTSGDNLYGICKINYKGEAYDHIQNMFTYFNMRGFADYRRITSIGNYLLLTSTTTSSDPTIVYGNNPYNLIILDPATHRVIASLSSPVIDNAIRYFFPVSLINHNTGDLILLEYNRWRRLRLEGGIPEQIKRMVGQSHIKIKHHMGNTTRNITNSNVNTFKASVVNDFYALK